MASIFSESKLVANKTSEFSILVVNGSAKVVNDQMGVLRSEIKQIGFQVMMKCINICCWFIVNKHSHNYNSSFSSLSSYLQ